ncbi:bifunctional DNA primase/polymerase [Polyangium jinanense]|uniref:Bifunctional DNA primase/polymerase n=1 Tax=Polyangium jinanense TaxID=2829994 RepID=A0A9X3XH36_9BACT|nr:bifunctional DNA primase/polymerase [Polyangium jinanense]MDC3962753.1 bifunctional DNA primase/polymerase [Polyangium jinanense]MDC3989260.1 bifunctional DNA primase/polymerase [Polyangium jinanense]
MGPLLDAALSYAKAWKWPVFPLHGVHGEGDAIACTCDAGPTCDRKGRHPRFPEAIQRATCDEATIRQWWAECPDANIGLPTGATSGIVALEINPAEDGAATIYDALEAGHELPGVPWLDTSSGALHLFQAPEDPIKGRLPVDRGLYLRGDGSFVVLEPSTSEDGSPYRFRDGAGPGMVAPVPLPPWILDKVAGRQPSDAKPPAEPDGYIFAVRSAADIFEAPISDADWLVRGLQLCRGARPAIVVAFSGTGKTLILQALVLACVTGRAIWGSELLLPNGRLRVLHLDVDQGERASFKRYRKLARGMGIDWRAEVQGQLCYRAFPPMSLTDEDAEQRLLANVRGYDLVIIDAFLGMIPGEDDNKATVGRFLHLMRRVAAGANVGFVIIHHTGKGGGDGSNAAIDPKRALRGSSTIRDNAGAVFLISGEKGEPKRIELTKDAEDSDGEPFEPIYVEFRDIPIGDNPRAALDIVAVTEDEAKERAEEEKKKQWAPTMKKALLATQRCPGISKTKLFDDVKGNRDVFNDVVAWLLRKGFVENKGSDTRHKYELGEVGQAWLDKPFAGSRRPSGDVRTGETEPDPEPE